MIVFSPEKMFASFVVSVGIGALTQSIVVAIFVFLIVFGVATFRPPII